MTIRHAIWKVGTTPTPLQTSVLASEQQLEEMIVVSPAILHDQWMLIGRQHDTGFGGRIDLLAITPDGSLVLVELKRGKTPREVVAQAIDYATFVEGLKAEDIVAIYQTFKPGQDLAADFKAKFGQQLDEEALNASHQIVIVADTIDESTTRIVGYLNQRDIAINVLCFQVFASGNDRFLSRVWLLDPAETQANAATAPAREKEPWNGEFYASFGHGDARSWPEAQRHGFISAGGGTWYSNSLRLLRVGDRIWAKAPGYGFVGVGKVTGPRIPASEFKIGDQLALDVLKDGHYHRSLATDPEKSEYFVPIEWLQTLALEQAIQEIGMFGNQNTVCRPTTPKWRQTVERLKLKLTQFDK
jgi:hypothetical protein